MKKFLTALAAMAVCMSSVPMTYVSVVNAVPVTAAESAFNESEYFVVVGTYHSRDGENYTQLRYENGGSAEKVAWKNAPEGLTYGDILVAEGDVELTEVYEQKDNPVYAMASVNYLNDDAVLRKVGHCTELMERKKLTVTSTMYDGSGHFSIYLEDENGKEYYYGLSTVGSSLGVNLAYDAEYGDNVTFMFCNGNISIPLEVAKPLVPSWVPKSFEEAMEFYNEYGVTHVSNGNNGFDVVCLVFPESASSSKNYEIRTTESVNKIYYKTFKSPIGDTKYEVVAYYDDCKSPTSFSIDLNCNDEIQWSYVFDSDGSGNLNETDLYSWVPDCITEFNEFEKENGVMSVKDGYVAYCQTSNPSTGYGWTWNQSGDGELTKTLESGCTEKYEIPPTGGAGRTFYLLKPEKDGKVNLNLVYERTFEPNSAIETIDKTYLISENCTKIKEVSNSLNLPELKQGEARVIITDYDTGELIPEAVFSSMEYFMMGTNIGYKNPNVDGGWMYTGPMFEIDSNPYYCDELAGFIDADSFGVNLTVAPQGYYLPDDYRVITINDNGSLEIEFRLKKYTKGDANGDGNFSIADAVLLQKWLLAVPDVKLPNWKAADLCEDGTLNVFDLCMMKCELISNADNKPVLTRTELRDIILSKEEFTWSDFEKYQSEDVGSGLYILKYKIDFEDENNEVYLYLLGNDLQEKPGKIYIEAINGDEAERKDIYDFRQDLLDFIDSFSKQQMTMDDVFELAKNGKSLTWADFDNYEHSEDIGSGISIYEFQIADYSDRFSLRVGFVDDDVQYVRLVSSGSSIDIDECSENDINMFIAEHNPPA